jgi:integrin alpha FG-GAP repeat containing protein 1
VTRRGGEYTRAFTGMIPNSQIVIIPYQEVGVRSTAGWILELYVRPSASAFLILAVLCGVMLVLAGVVFVLYAVEKREDENEKRRLIHAINFDAL